MKIKIQWKNIIKIILKHFEKRKKDNNWDTTILMLNSNWMLNIKITIMEG